MRKVILIIPNNCLLTSSKFYIEYYLGVVVDNVQTSDISLFILEN